MKLLFVSDKNCEKLAEFKKHFLQNMDEDLVSVDQYNNNTQGRGLILK